MSYTKTNAVNYNVWVRKFFAGGHKSDNKLYSAEPAKDVTLKEGQAEKRALNQPKAQQTRVAIHQQKTKGQMPADLGFIISKQKLKGGNCAEMTWLLSYAFKTKQLKIWVVVISDPGDHQFCILSAKKPDYANIESMKYMGEDQWVIDPWAGIVCKPGEFAEEFRGKMKKWTGKGKRIGVPNAQGTAYIWTPGTDVNYLSAILDSGLKYRKGWDFT